VISAIPTKYAGVQFRSRLEARWAAFFDLLGWQWDYEPIDLAGYIPDFIVSRPLGVPFLAEVKPVVDWPCPVPGCYCRRPSLQGNPVEQQDRETMDEAIEKIQNSGWTKHAVIVGAAMVPSGQLVVPRFGLPVDTANNGSWFDTEIVITRCPRCSAYFAQPDIEIWATAHNCDDSKRPSIPIDPTPLWREAGNRVQWKAPQ
jgi:hypothetical protein